MAYATTQALNPNLAMRSGARAGCCDDCSCNCVASGCCPDCVAPGISSARRSRRSMSGFGVQPHGWNQGGLAGVARLPARSGRRRYAGRRAMGDDSPCGCAQVDASDPNVTDAQIAAMNSCNAKCNASTQSGAPTSPGQAQAANTGLLAGAASVIGRLFGAAPAPAYPYQTGPDLTTILLLAGLGIGAVYFVTKD